MKRMGILVSGFVLLLIGCSGSDILPPVPGNGGDLLVTDVTQTSAAVIWSEAVDLTTEQSLLQYKLVYSESANLETPENAETNGTVITDWTADIASGNAAGLTAETEYYFNVIVKDEAGNMAVYKLCSAETADSTAPAAGSDGELIITDLKKNSFSVSWTEATDSGTPGENLEYKAVYSPSNNVSTGEGAETNGTVALDWQTGADTAEITGLSRGTEYFVNVLVRDSESNVSAYSMTAVETPEPYLIIADGGNNRILKMSLDGSESSVLFDLKFDASPVGLAVDPSREMLFWSNQGTYDIRKGNVDGSRFNLVAGGTHVHVPTVAVMDPAPGVIYWINTNDFFIKRTNIDGDIVEEIIQRSDKLSLAWGAALDRVNKILYWTNDGISPPTTIDGIFKIHLNETSTSTVVDASGAVDPYGLALDPDTDTLYWTQKNGIVRKSEISGANQDDVITTGLDWPLGIAFFEGTLYITDWNADKVFSYNLDEGSLVEMTDQVFRPYEIEVYDPE